MLLLVVVIGAPHTDARSTTAPPPLAPPGGSIIRVTTEQQLQEATRRLQSNTTIVIARGTYHLTSTLWIGGSVSGVGVRGETGNRDDVVLVGAGFTHAASGLVPYGIATRGNVQDLEIANLTIRDVYDRAILFAPGTERPHVYNVRLLDAGSPVIEARADGAPGVDDGVIEYSVIEYTGTARDAGSIGVSIQGGSRWIVRHNLLRNIVGPSWQLAGPAILARGGGRDTIVEGNTILDCSVGIALGLVDAAGPDHYGGVVRNNMIFRSSTVSGGPGILVADSPNTQVLNNTVVLSRTYGTPVEYQFPGARGVAVLNNLSDGPTWARDGASGVENGNVDDASPRMFVDAPSGDLHLTPQAVTAIDRGITLANVLDDWDGGRRPAGRAYDVGADELGAVKPAPGRALPGPRSAASITAPATNAMSASPDLIAPGAASASSSRARPVARPGANPNPGTPGPEPPSAPLPALPDGDPTGWPLVRPGNLTYVGAFRLPNVSNNGYFSFGGGVMAFNPANNSLFVGNYHNQIAEVTIPTPVNSAVVTSLPFASYLQAFGDPVEGHLDDIESGGGGVSLAGLAVFGGSLYGTAAIFYDANGIQTVSHYRRSLNLSTPSFSGFSAVWQPTAVDVANGVTKTGTGYASGYIAAVPGAWQSRLGGTAISGMWGWPIVTRESWGPAAIVWNPAQLGSVDGKALMYYTPTHPTLGPWANASELWGAAASTGGVALIDGTRTALWVGRNGLGRFCYGDGTADPGLDGQPSGDGGTYCYDPAISDKGNHAYPYTYEVWAYDMNDWVAVKNGIAHPWDVVPYATWTLDLPTTDPSWRGIGAVAYDPERQLLYVSQLRADPDGYDYRALIHVFSIR